jgi:hypothetical protein
MRLALVCILLVITLPLAAAELGWTQYGNARFGYIGEVPAGFSGSGESDSGDGQTFRRPGAGQVLSYWASIYDGSLEDAVRQRMAFAERDGWGITYQATTPRWASYSGQMGNRIFYTRVIQLCGRDSYGVFTVQYSTVQAADMRPTVERLVRSFRADGC